MPAQKRCSGCLPCIPGRACRARPAARMRASDRGSATALPGKVERFWPPPIDFAWLFQIACDFPTHFPTSVPRRHAHFQLRLLRTEAHDPCKQSWPRTPAEQG
jgi:hypothetical protein